MSNKKLDYHEVLNDFLLLRWNDGSENSLPLKPLRDNCPCANCAGETDIFGNIYKGPPQRMKKESYVVRMKIPDTEEVVFFDKDAEATYIAIKRKGKYEAPAIAYTLGGVSAEGFINPKLRLSHF